MTTYVECRSNDFIDSVNLISALDVTTEVGASEAELKSAELRACQGKFNNHVHDHSGHTARYSFSIPEGYVKRGGIIYKAK